MIAGYDMTGLALSWFFYFLTKSSFVVTKIIFLFYERKPSSCRLSGQLEDKTVQPLHDIDYFDFQQQQESFDGTIFSIRAVADYLNMNRWRQKTYITFSILAL
nr:uncharacterized protein LOC127321948 [Lolium perenne]